LDELRRDERVTLRVGPAFRFLVDYAPFCTAGIEELVVSSNGDVYPCSGFLGYDGPEAVGNVSASTLEDVWTSAPFVCATRNLINDRLANRAMHRVGCPFAVPRGPSVHARASRRRPPPTLPYPKLDLL